MDEGDWVEEDQVGRTVAALSSQNALSENALSQNKLSINKLSINKLSINKLSINSLEFNDTSGWNMENTASGRELLRYLAKCALPLGTELVNGADVYPGLLGVAPAWEDRGLSLSEQRLVSACLGAHTNKFGTSVQISVRWDTAVSAGESDFNTGDAAFYGNYFDPNDTIHVCKLPTNVSYPSDDSSLRVCDDSNANCGFSVKMHDCTIMCQTWDLSGQRKVYQHCRPQLGTGHAYTEVMNVYLRSN